MESSNTDKHISRILALDEMWTNAARNYDLDGMISIYADDARELLPGMEQIEGLEAIRAFYAGVINNFPRFRHVFDPEEIVVSDSGDLAVARGSYQFTADTDRPDEVENGKYVGVWRRRDGDWRLVLNISNVND